METWIIEQTLEQEGHRGIHYEVSLKRPDGIRIARFFDDDALECRAAEYGFDPDTELDLLIEVCLYEFHIPDPTHPGNFENDAAAKAGKRSAATKVWGRQVALGDQVPTWLFNSASASEAREAHLLRVEAAKQKIRFVEATKNGKKALDLIRSNAQLNPGVIQAKARQVRNLVDNHRKDAEVLAARAQLVTPSYRVRRRPLPPTSTPLPKNDLDRKRVEAYENQKD